MATTNSKNLGWLWTLIPSLCVIGALSYLLVKSYQKEPQIVEKNIEIKDTVLVEKTVYIQEIEEIEKDFNAAEFAKGKAVLAEKAKFVLHDLAQVMQKNPEIKLRLEGHTSAEGSQQLNQKLSEQRAQAAVDFLVNFEEIDPSRLEAVGFGSSKLKNTDDPKAPENRRTEFIVIE